MSDSDDAMWFKRDSFEFDFQNIHGFWENQMKLKYFEINWKIRVTVSLYHFDNARSCKFQGMMTSFRRLS